jgi:hypothetical protein
MNPASASRTTCSGVTLSGATVSHHRIELAAAGEHELDILFLHRPDELRVVGSLAGDGEMRAFEMQPEEPRHALRFRSLARLDCLRGDLERVGDQRRQQSGGAKPGMRGADCCEPLDRRLLVEQHATAAVHLQVDETRDDHPAVGIDRFEAGRQPVRGLERLHLAVRKNERGIVMPEGPVEDPGAGEGLASRHRVSVTFFRATGASGLKPLARDQASTKP